MIKITCFSDTHGQHHKLDEWFGKNSGDILIFSGDLQTNNFDDGTDFVKWFSSLDYRKKIIVFGNHDGNYQMVRDESQKYNNLVLLNHEPVRILGINIFGSPYSVKFGNWWFMETERELERLYNQIPDNTELLITHTPAFGVGDVVEGISVGSYSLKKRTEKLKKLKYHVFGHIHEGYGTERIGKITHVNGSLMDERYRAVNQPINFCF